MSKLPILVQGSREKELLLRSLLREMRSVIVALSGGVDSSYLSYIASQELGNNALAVTADSPSYPHSLKEETIKFTALYGIRHEIITTDEINDERYLSNGPDRCYYCKTELFEKLIEMARKRGFNGVCDGNNYDDKSDYRPGLVAARQLGVRSPLMEAGMTKSDIRQMSRLAGLPVWDKPAQACLSSRVPHGQRITIQKLSAIERGEELLKSLGFRIYRLRHHGDIARIELGIDELERALVPTTAQAIVNGIKSLGFRYVTIDLEGYRTGSVSAAKVDITVSTRQ
ncbi:MAG: ATP-dependent sacrificial sulfur transferase LarE [Acidobacteriota bacterium]|nr:ATP-dependent sacrificial sulfur transferase LarE [Blastocatellia bacterium]MDW8413331.1 ATP-dependent sacrificial sulfur transferase LarE [Acidobacteriota bacterium]